MHLLRFKALVISFLLVASFFCFQIPTKSFTTPKIDPAFFSTIKTSSEFQSIIIKFKEDPSVSFLAKRDLPKTFESIYVDDLKQRQNNWIKEAKIKFPFIVNYCYQHVYNGISITLRGYNIQYLVSDPNVDKIFDAGLIFHKERHLVVDTLSVKKTWNNANKTNEKITGKGVKVGIIDTGLDYKHPDFLDESGKTSRIKGGMDFADKDNDFYDSGSTFKAGFVPHGTHVAGISSGNNLKDSAKKGMAPDSELYIYKVFSNNSDGAYSKDIIAAINQSVINKCQVINMSIGNSMPAKSVDPGNPYYDAINNATKAGVVVVCAAGNAGSRSSSQKTTLDSPGIYEPSIQVAGTDDRMNVLLKIERLDESYQLMNCPKFAYSPPFSSIKQQLEIVDCGYGGASDFNDVNVSGKVALISRGPKNGSLTFKEKNLNAKKAGAIAAITYNYDETSLKGTLVDEKDDPYSLQFIPNITISGINATILKDSLKKEAKIMVYAENQVSIFDMSSSGPCLSGDENIFKPEICSPGKQICSAIMSVNKSKAKVPNPYDDWDGTSMSTPGVTGVIALIRQAHPKWSASEVKSVLMNSSDVLINPISNLPFSFFNQGAGQANALSAINATVITSPPALMRNIDRLRGNISFDIKNVSDNKSSTLLSWEIFGETAETSPITATFDQSEISLDREEKKSFSVSFQTDIKMVSKKRYEGVIWLQTGTAKQHIPVILYKDKITDNENSISNFSLNKQTINVAESNPCDIKFQINAGSRFLVTGISPQYEELSNCVETFKIEVLDNKKEVLGTIFYAENLFVGQYQIPWNGNNIFDNSFLPNGKYFLRAELSGKKWVIENNRLKEEVYMPIFSDLKQFTIEESELPMPPLLIIGCQDKIEMGSEFVLDIIFANVENIQEIELKISFLKSSTSIISYSIGEFVDQRKFNPKNDIEFIDGLFIITAQRNDLSKKARLHVASIKLKADNITPKTGLITVADMIKATNSEDEPVRTVIEYPAIVITKSAFKYGDFNKDGKINDLDLDLLMEKNLTTYIDKEWDEKYDLNHDLIINLSDLAIFSRYYEKE